MVPHLIALVEGSDRHPRQGDCEALGFIKSVESLPVLARLLSHEDRWLGYAAAQAIKTLARMIRRKPKFDRRAQTRASSVSIARVANGIGCLAGSSARTGAARIGTHA